MPERPLPERLQAVRDSLSWEDMNLLCQDRLNELATAIYNEGFKNGKAKALEAQQTARERRRKGGRVEWLTSVYFIRSPRAIKIGMSNNPERRLGVLQTSHPEPLELVVWVEGGLALERDYHRRFAEHRLHGEWFSPAPDILAEIERLNDAPKVHDLAGTGYSGV